MSSKDEDGARIEEPARSASAPAVVEPEWGKLPSGLTISDVSTAIAYSGYPLQAAVTNALHMAMDTYRRGLLIQEEWAYVDKESSQVRSIDIFAELRFGDIRRRITSYINLLVECKQSELPYVFFLRDSPPSTVYDFPEIAGLPSTEIVVHTPKEDPRDLPPFIVSIHDLLGLWEIPFFELPCPFAISISKTVRKGSKVELTGEDAYRSLTLPLMKAADHLKGLSQPKAEHSWFSCRMILCVAVIRAPMLGVYRSGESETVTPIPWARICRLEPQQGNIRSIVRYYDCVHESYLPTYLEEMLKGAHSMATRLDSCADVVALGKGVSIDGDAVVLYQVMRPIRSEDEVIEPAESDRRITIARVRTSSKVMDSHGSAEDIEDPGPGVDPEKGPQGA